MPEESGSASQESSLRAVLGAIHEVGETFVHLLRAPRALWGLNLSYFLEGLAYFGVLTILGKYLSEDVGLEDLHAGWTYSFLTGGITLSMFFLGGVSDKIGVRRALLAALGLMVLGRVALACSGSFFTYGQGPASAMYITVLAALLLVVLGYGMYQPAAYAGVKQFSNKKTSAIGYAMIYALMNLGAFVSGIISPPIRHAHGMVGVYWAYVAITVAALLAILLILTRRVATAATERVRREDAEIERAESGDAKPAAVEEAPEERESAAKAPARSIFNPISIGLFLAICGLAAGTVYKACTTPTHPLEKSARAYKRLLKDARRELEGTQPRLPAERLDRWLGSPTGIARGWIRRADAAQDRKLGKRLSDLRDALGTLAREIRVPDSEGLVMDASAVEIFRAEIRATRASTPEAPAAAAMRTATPIDLAAARRARELLRIHAVRVMAMAYGLVAPMDEQVVASLRLRLKRIQEERIPVAPAVQSRMAEMASESTPRMLSALAEESSKLAESIRRSLPAAIGSWLAGRLEADREFEHAISQRGEPGELGRQLLLAKLLADSMLYCELADQLVTFGSRDELYPTCVSAARLGEIFFDQRSAMMREAASILPEAARLPAGKRFTDLMSRYGVLVIPGALLLLGLCWYLLRLRPEHPFHNGRFTYFIFILIPVQTLFAHNWLTLPLYINRAFGGTAVGENFEFFSNINPLLIFFLTPVVAALTTRARVYPMMIAGTLVMAVPTFLLVLQPHPALLVAYILLMSVGEAMWQPRFLQLVAEIAPEGKTGAYMGIAQLPWFLTKLVTGFYAGWFLSRYCPMVGPQDTSTLWLLYAFIAMLSPVGLILARRWIGSEIEKKHT
ncbi:MAG: MFS transporter [Deltaproteobacteria bacterium]|nr:MFS transporter [Deltaproteobacteria bacterium]